HPQVPLRRSQRDALRRQVQPVHETARVLRDGGEVHDAGHDRSRLHETMRVHLRPALVEPGGGGGGAGAAPPESFRWRRGAQASAAWVSAATAASALILSGRKPDQWSPPANTTGACW